MASHSANLEEFSVERLHPKIGAEVRGNKILDPYLLLMENHGEAESRDYAT